MKKQKKNSLVSIIIVAVVMVVGCIGAVKVDKMVVYANELSDIVEMEGDASTEQELTSEESTEMKNMELAIKKFDYEEKTVDLSWNGLSREMIKADVVDSISDIKYRVFIRKQEEEWENLLETYDIESRINIFEYGSEYECRVIAYAKTFSNDSLDIQVGMSNIVQICFPKSIGKITTTAISLKKVKLSWEDVDGANIYYVYKKNSFGEYEKVAETNESYVKLDVAQNRKYTYKVFAVYCKGEMKSSSEGKKVTFYNQDFVSIDHQKYTYKEMVSDIKSLAKKYGEYMSYNSIGKSEQGREIYDVILGNEDSSNCVLVVSALHSREYVATVTLMKQLEYYLQNYNKKIDGVIPADVFEKCCIHYVMMANPDGVTLSQTSDPRRKTNAKGVNLNNDFPYGISSSCRAKETRAIVAFTKELNKNKNLYVVNYHAMGQIVFGSYSGKNSSIKNRTKNMYNIARKTTGYADEGGYSSGSKKGGNGNYREYLLYKIKVPSITIEVGNVSCPVPQYCYKSIFKKNKLVIIREAKYVNKEEKL